MTTAPSYELTRVAERVVALDYLRSELQRTSTTRSQPPPTGLQVYQRGTNSRVYESAALGGIGGAIGGAISDITGLGTAKNIVGGLIGVGAANGLRQQRRERAHNRAIRSVTRSARLQAQEWLNNHRFPKLSALKECDQSLRDHILQAVETESSQRELALTHGARKEQLPGTIIAGHEFPKDIGVGHAPLLATCLLVDREVSLKSELAVAAQAAL